MSTESERTKFDYSYSGTIQPPQNGTKDSVGRTYHPYIPSDDLREVVNLALKLQRPLLLEGDPGCGKTKLAGAIAYELTQRYLAGKTDKDSNPLWWPYYIWNVKSVSQAQDGLYRYDAVARLRDAQLVGSDPQRLAGYLGEEESKKLIDRLKDRRRYREFGPLGKALRHRDQRPILLIDEIDKADSDFPNDLLLELDELRFEIPQTGEEIPTPDQKPIILITSNREKPLPEPFLRRCLYFYVDFPDEERLLTIIQQRFGAPKRGQTAVIKAAVKRFYEIRELLADEPGSREPGTSEFLEFLSVLLQKSSKEAQEDLENLAERLPLLGTLLKNRADQQRFQASEGRKNKEQK